MKSNPNDRGELTSLPSSRLNERNSPLSLLLNMHQIEFQAQWLNKGINVIQDWATINVKQK